MQHETFGYEIATPQQRLVALITEDVLIFTPLCLIFGAGHPLLNNSMYLAFMAVGWSAFAGGVLYPLFSGNAGHRLWKLKVISVVDGSEQRSFFAGAKREGLKGLLRIVFIPVIWLLFNPLRQNIYDQAVKTIVVKRRKPEFDVL